MTNSSYTKDTLAFYVKTIYKSFLSKKTLNKLMEAHMKKSSKKNFILLILLLSFLMPSLTSEAKSGAVLVLSGGGLRGLAHIGVIKVLIENDVEIVGIVGTSMGALMGGLFAIGYSPDEIKDIVDEIDLSSMLAEHTGQLYVPTTSANMATDTSVFWLKKTWTGEQSGPLGFFAATKMFNKFTELSSRVDVVDFMQLPVPFAAIATDINTGEKVVLKDGSIASAMRASMSIPGIFEPWRIGDKLLVDGGLVSNLPVLTAKELFPGFPIIAVDVSDNPDRGKKVENVMDVLDRSLTILTHKNVLEERQFADEIIAPDVFRFGIFDQAQSDQIFEAGINAANEKIDAILELLNNKKAPDRIPAPKKEDENRLVKDILVHGLPPKSASVVKAKYKSWIGKPVDLRDIIEASKEIATRNDILAADYRIEYMNGLIVVLEVTPMPDLEIGLSGYTTNIDPYRWLHLQAIKRGLFSDRDSLFANIFISEDWGLDFAYRTAPEPTNFWEFRISAEKWSLSPANSSYKNWIRYTTGLNRIFKVGNLEIGLGYAYEYVNSNENNNSNSSGPTLSLAYSTLDLPSDPSSGSALNASMWWANFDEFLFRVNFFKPFKITDAWRANFRLGYAEGSMKREEHAVYLGAAEELYSIAGNPISGRRAAWANIAFRRVLGKSIFGTISGEIFGGFGYVWNENNERIANPWEAGIALSIPNNVIDTKVAVFYTSEKEFRFAFFLGTPVWGHYPLP